MTDQESRHLEWAALYKLSSERAAHFGFHYEAEQFLKKAERERLLAIEAAKENK